MRRSFLGGGVSVAAMIAAVLAGVGGRGAPTPTPTATFTRALTATATSTRSNCLASANCFPKPINTGAGATGIPPGTTLKACGGDVTLSVDHQTVNACRYAGNVTITADNVTIRNSRIVGGAENVGAKFLIEDSEIGPDTCGDGTIPALVRWGSYTARRNYVHGNGDGMRFSGNNIVATDNFISTCDNPGDHSDGIQGHKSGINNTVEHNTIDLRGSLNGPDAAVF